MKTIENQQLRVGVDEQGRLSHLERIGGHGNVISSPAPLFHAILKNGENWEEAIFGAAQTYEVIAQENQLIVRARALTSRKATFEIDVTLTLTLRGEELLFDAQVQNQSQATLTDFYYPCVGSIETLQGGKPDLLWPKCAGQRIPAIGDYVGTMGDWDGEHVMSESYPGHLSMQWMTLVDGDECLYLAGHDSLPYSSVLRVVGSKAHDTLLEIDKLAFVAPGETWACPPALLMCYQGDWKRGAEEYTAWCKTWRHPVEPAEWIKDMNGYFLVINKQQYGDEIWPYETLPELWEYAKAHGCDTLGLFGWYHSGHDNQYPELEVSPTLGGADALKENIKKVQADGAHVTLYYQGHLMDITTQYYQEKGRELEGRTRSNTPYFEEYSKFHGSEFLKKFSKKMFATVCPSCPEWQALMVQRADWLASFGASGMLYDQLGGMPPYPCFNEKHPHMLGKPSLSHTVGRRQLLEKLHEQAKTHGQEFAFMTEHETDVHSQYLDALHGIATNAGPVAGRRRDGGSLLNLNSSFPQMFRYCFPETIITIRNPNPFLCPRDVNYAFLFGFRYEMELRYLKDQEDIRQGVHADWRDYAKKVGALRKKNADLLLRGMYREEKGIKTGNNQLLCALYQGATRQAVALWNDTEETQPVSLTVAGKTITGYETVDGEFEGIPKSIAPQSVLLIHLV